MTDHAPPLFVLSDRASVCFLNTSKTMSDAVDRTVIGFSILAFSLASIFLNTVVVVAIFHSWKSFRGQPFTQFVLSMVLAGTIYTAVNFFVSIPCSLSYCPYLDDDSLLIVMSLPNTLSFVAYLLANFGFAIYRSCIVFDFLRNYRRTVHIVTLWLPWILSIYAVVDTTLRGCIKRFNRWSIGYTYNCSSCNVWFGVSFIDVNFYAGQILPVLMCLMYGVMIADIYWKKSQNNGILVQNQNKSTAFDVKLAFQYLLVCLVQYLASFLFYIIPKYWNGSTFAVIALNVIGVIDMGLNPLILLVFNSKLRFATLSLFSFLPFVSVPKPKTATVTIFMRKSTF